MKDTISIFEGSLRTFAEELASIKESLLGWLQDETLKTTLRLADGQTTWNVCQGIREHMLAVFVVMDVIEHPDNYCCGSLESAVNSFDPWETPMPWITDGPSQDRSSVGENLADLLEFIDMAARMASTFLTLESGAILESDWSGDSDTRWASEEVDSKVSLLREKAEMLTLVVSDLIDPRGQQFALLVDRIESNLKELKSRMAIAANKKPEGQPNLCQ